MNEVRLIDANALAERVREHISVAGKEKIVKIIEEQATMDPWISVADKLPEDPDKACLAVASGTYENMTFQNAVLMAYYDPKENDWMFETWKMVHGLKVSYWMPVPSVPGFKDRISPCDLCVYDPPSSFGGKPCALCPATPKERVEDAQSIRVLFSVKRSGDV